MMQPATLTTVAFLFTFFNVVIQAWYQYQTNLVFALMACLFTFYCACRQWHRLGSMKK